VGVPLEGARPRVQHGERADVAAEPLRIGTQGGEGIERGAEEGADERLLVLAHGAAELRRQREDDVEVGNWQQQVTLSLEPAPGGAVAAAGAGPVMARVRQHMLTAARGAQGEMTAERTGATERDRVERADVPLRHGRAVPSQVVPSVPDMTSARPSIEGLGYRLTMRRSSTSCRCSTPGWVTRM
jgi:hypothetical protein